MEREAARLFEEQLRTVEAALPTDALDARIALGGIYFGVMELDQRATRDGKTGLPNYRALLERDQAQQLHVVQDTETGESIERRADAPKPILGWWVTYLDLDNFKLINDVLGHPVGDRTLRVIADAITLSIRDDDEAYRDGGDEFIVFAPVTELPPADYSFGVDLSERMRLNLQLLCGPQGAEYLPSGLELGPIEHEALEVVDWTIGETFVSGPVINRFAELALADAAMLELKNGQPRV